MAELGRLGVAVSSFGALGAALRLRASGDQVDPAIDAALRHALGRMLPSSLETLAPDEIATALNFIAFNLEEAREMVRDPARPPVWRIEDPDVLQTMGDISRALPRRILAFAADRPRLAKAATGRFLDIGTGVGAIALEIAERCPTLQVVGLDIWEPALRLARANVARSPFAGRIEIRAESIADFDERSCYTLAFVAAPFMTREIVEIALDRLAAAIVPDGYIVVSIYIPQEDPLLGALTDLRRIRGGGYAWTVESMRAAISDRGFVDIEVQPGLPQLGLSPTLVFARQPAA
jgi:precorrin-6B methylase 2